MTSRLGVSPTRIIVSQTAAGEPTFLIPGLGGGDTWLSWWRGRGPGAVHGGVVDLGHSQGIKSGPCEVGAGSGCHFEGIQGSFKDAEASRYIPAGQVSNSGLTPRLSSLSNEFVGQANLGFHRPPNSTPNLKWVERACGIQMSWRGTMSGDCRSFTQTVRTKPAPTIMVPPRPNGGGGYGPQRGSMDTRGIDRREDGEVLSMSIKGKKMCVNMCKLLVEKRPIQGVQRK
jgi:hypothetical protein